MKSVKSVKKFLGLIQSMLAEASISEDNAQELANFLNSGQNGVVFNNLTFDSSKLFVLTTSSNDGDIKAALSVNTPYPTKSDLDMCLEYGYTIKDKTAGKPISVTGKTGEDTYVLTQIYQFDDTNLAVSSITLKITETEDSITYSCTKNGAVKKATLA